jgi:hypothetical protein
VGFEPAPLLAQDVEGYDPDVVFETLPSPTASPNLGILSPELRQLVRWWPGLTREIQEVILGLARPWRGDGS